MGNIIYLFSRFRRRKWQPTPVFLPGESHERKSLVGYSPWVAKSRTRLSDFTFTHFTFQGSACNSLYQYFIPFLREGLPWWLRWQRICPQCGRPWIPWTEEPGGLQSTGSQRVGHDWMTLLTYLLFDPWVRKISWRRKCRLTPVFLPGESHGQRNLVGYIPWDCKELDMTERLTLHSF